MPSLNAYAGLRQKGRSGDCWSSSSHWKSSESAFGGEDPGSLSVPRYVGKVPRTAGFSYYFHELGYLGWAEVETDILLVREDA